MSSGSYSIKSDAVVKRRVEQITGLTEKSEQSIKPPYQAVHRCGRRSVPAPTTTVSHYTMVPPGACSGQAWQPVRSSWLWERDRPQRRLR
jgi:hypothetical protein